MIHFVTHDQIPQILKLNYLAKIPTCLVGGVGCGKTTAAKEFAKRIGLDPTMFFASLIEGTDIGGFPYTYTPDESTMKRVGFAMLESLPYDNEDHAVVILDELDRAQVDVQNACTQLLLSESIHGHRLSPNAMLIATINAESDLNTNVLSGAVTNRMCMIYVSSITAENNESYSSWALRNGIHKSIVGFSNHQKDLISTNYEFKEVAFTSSRSRDYLSRIMHVIDQDTKSDYSKVLLPVFSGIVGSETALKFMSYLKYFDKIPPIDDFIKDPALLAKYIDPTDSAFSSAFICAAIANADENNYSSIAAFVDHFASRRELQRWLMESLKIKIPAVLTDSSFMDKFNKIKEYQ